MIRLSDAIRLGATLKPQGRYGRGGENSSCALQAAAEAIGAKSWTDMAVTDTFPVLKERFRNPVTGKKGRLLEMIWDLNDSYDWTREQIAVFVATIEPQEPTDTACEPARETSNIGA